MTRLFYEEKILIKNEKGDFTTYTRTNTGEKPHQYDQCDQALVIQELTLERNHTNAINVTRPSHRRVSLLYIQENTLERNHINAVNVRRPSQRRVALLSIQEHTLERNHINAVNVKRPSN